LKIEEGWQTKGLGIVMIHSWNAGYRIEDVTIKYSLMNQLETENFINWSQLIMNACAKLKLPCLEIPHPSTESDQPVRMPFVRPVSVLLDHRPSQRCYEITFRLNDSLFEGSVNLKFVLDFGDIVEELLKSKCDIMAFKEVVDLIETAFENMLSSLGFSQF